MSFGDDPTRSLVERVISEAELLVLQPSGGCNHRRPCQMVEFSKCDL